MRNLKKVIALVAVFAMLVSTVAFATSFSDVKDDDNYAEAIEMLSNLGILTGDDQDGDGVMDFRPNDTITRAEVAAIVCRVQNLNNLAQTGTQFTDVTSSHWASGYVAQAAGKGIINGNGDGTFAPEANVKFQDVVKMFVRTLGYEPYVNANGGYPAGDLAAANRYGVLDGVINSGNEAEATRGQVAQIAYNSLDTPLMDRKTYGADAEWIIYNGKGETEGDFQSLLTQYLGVKKVQGIVDGTQITKKTDGEDIDTSNDAKISIDTTNYIGTDDYKNYEVKDVDTIICKDNAEDTYGLYGMDVTAYVKETGKSKEYELISIAASTKNKTKEFTLDLYDVLATDKKSVKFFKNKDARTSDTLKLSDEVQVLFNNVYFDAADMADVFGGTYVSAASSSGSSALVEKNSPWSGKVTFIDNGDTSDYDVVKVEIGAPAVVKEVSAKGKVAFKENASNANGDTIKQLDFDDTDETQIINLTKDGKAMDWADLKEWDVLSILYNGETEGYYDVKVVGSNAIDGTISSKSNSETSADGKKYVIAGNTYEVAKNAFGTKTGGWNPGTAGMFYIDEYGKIIAYDKNGSTTASTSNGNYAYVLNATSTKDDWSKDNVRVQILDKDGKVYDAYLASSVKFENITSVGLAQTDFKAGSTETGVDVTSKVDEIANVEKVASAMVNQLITYDANSSGEIKTVTFFQEDEDENTLYLDNKPEVTAGTKLEYDGEDKELGKYTLTDDTIVFFIKGTGTISFGGSATASKSASKVGTIATLAEGKYVAGVYDVDNDVPGAVVLFNTSGGISKSSNIAVIDSIGTASVDDDTVTSVTYFMNGEKMTSNVDADLESAELDGIESATQGSIYKFAVSADGATITAVEKIASFDNSTRKAKEGTPNMLKDLAKLAPSFTENTARFTNGINTANADDEILYYGPVYDFNSTNNRFRFGTLKTGSTTEYNFDKTTGLKDVKAKNANVYVFDPIRGNNKIYVGSASDVDYNTNLADATASVTSKDGSVIYATNGATAIGMYDYVAAYEYDKDVLDVVIYKTYDFGKINY